MRMTARNSGNIMILQSDKIRTIIPPITRTRNWDVINLSYCTSIRIQTVILFVVEVPRDHSMPSSILVLITGNFKVPRDQITLFTSSHLIMKYSTSVQLKLLYEGLEIISVMVSTS